jgi:fermentation-respiration switch protein FrsA (DUF1100 family)
VPGDVLNTLTAERTQQSLPVHARRQRPLLVAGAAVAGGMLATAVGGGVGIRYAIKTGLSPTSVLGLALLCVGLFLLGYAVVLAWRAVRRWRRLWLVPTAAVAIAVTFAAGLGVMYAVAPRSALGSTTPARYGLAYTDVTFMTTDHVRLSAWYIRSTNRAAVVLMPGAGSVRTGVLAQAAVLARDGYGALLFDPRGQGRSGGRAMDIGWYGDRDLGAAVAYLQQQPDVDPSRIGVVGLSMGGEAAIGAAAAVPAIRAVVAEGATARTAADKDGWLPGGVPGTIQRGLDRLTFAVTRLLSPADQPVSLHEAVGRAASTSFLLITGGEVADEASAAAYFRTAAPERVQIWTVPGAGHTEGLTVQREAWTSRVTGFMDDALLR